jgi:transcriptional regulator
MYQPSHFRIEDHAALHALMREHPLATLVVPTAAGLEINHVPLHVDVRDGALVLVGHVARANPVWQAATTGEAAAVFQGPQTYITPNWYPSKREHGKVVPTWNYSAVQLSGRARVHEDAEWLRAAVDMLTERHEGPRDEPWATSDAPEQYIHGQLRAIVGIEITVERVDGKAKLSQNLSAADRDGVVVGLRQEPLSGALEVADQMSVHPSG